MSKPGIRLEGGGATENTSGLNPMIGIAREDLIKSPAKKDEDPNDPNAGATV